ncbi:hypothetical protein VB715_21765 [Crocosphaera sp. UHCC 0190]|uniref:hypothetical protein n=1 Tax=Crocosphaera sp. UHCC 0190 TaxID=3110246 RepID=UPI002B202023|nr:hypothetical protein [Crocosphaera sp. UHCC 0190]MEA5512401.1 hypothetical protein [Crocosphaera sp. UHCC 0190]
METVTPVSSSDAKETQQIQQQSAAQALKIAQLVMELIEKLLLKLEGEKKDEKEENKNNQQQGNESINNESSPKQQQKQSDNNLSSTVQNKTQYPLSLNNLEITINGEKKLGDSHNNLTWEDYGKIQALIQEDVGNKVTELANIKGEKVTSQNGQIKRQPLLETDEQGTVLHNAFKSSQPKKKLSGFEAINRALSKLPDNETKTYLTQVNQQISQQFQQQQQLLEEAKNFNQQLSLQLQTSQSTLLESQQINQDYAKLILQYQQLEQKREPKDPQSWQKLVKNSVNSVQQWWQDRKQKYDEKAQNIQYAANLKYFAKEMMGENTKLSGTDYNLERKGNHYQLKDSQGSLLLSFQNRGVLGVKIDTVNLNSNHQEDLKLLKTFRDDPNFFVKHSQFVFKAIPEPEPIFQVPDSSQSEPEPIFRVSSSSQPEPDIILTSSFNKKTQTFPEINRDVSKEINLEKKENVIDKKSITSDNLRLPDVQNVVKSLKELIAKTSSALETINVKGYGIKTDQKGEYMRINRFSDQQVLLEVNGNNSTVKSALTQQDVLQLNYLIKQALTQIQKPSSQQVNRVKGR